MTPAECIVNGAWPHPSEFERADQEREQAKEMREDLQIVQRQRMAYLGFPADMQLAPAAS